MRISRASLLLALPFALLLAKPSGALTITTADGVGADSYVFWTSGMGSPEPDTNYGAATSVRTRAPLVLNSTAFSGTRKTYLRFDLGALAGDSVLTAELLLNFAGGDATDTNIRVWGLDDGNAGESWGESTLTWNNAPANAQNASLVDANQATYLGLLFRSDDAPVDEVVTFTSAELATFLNADSDGQVTLILTGEGDFGGGVFSAFTSKESTTGAPPPTLGLTVIPEPSTALLLALGLMSLGARRRGPA